MQLRIKHLWGILGALFLLLAPASSFAQPGTVKISTSPEGAWVFVDGEPHGKSPFTLQSDTPKSVRVRLVLPGYETEESLVQILPGASSNLVFTLARGGREVRFEPELAAGSIWTDPATGMQFVWVPGGCFQMGSPASEQDRSSGEGPQHEVCVDGFWLGKYEVTQGQWQKVMANNPSYFKNGDNYPVEQVSWNDAQEFIKKLSAMDGGKYTFALPSEAQWEYACRAGTRTPFYFGETISTEQANYDGNFVYGNGRKGVYRKQTTPVGSFPANAFGLCDMHGNIVEWCEDIYSVQAYSRHQRSNPIYTGTEYESGSRRVLRGGSWDRGPRYLRLAFRGRDVAAVRISYVGFRLARTR